MSTKIYDVYKFVGTGKTEPTLNDVYKFLQPIKNQVVKFYKNMSYDEEVINLHKLHFKTPRGQKSEFETKYGGLGYEGVTEECVVYTHKTGLYIHFFLGFHFRDLRNRLSKSKKLQDYHYQNQSDRPDNISPKEWNTRRKFWDEIIGHRTPSDAGFIYNFMTYRNFELILYDNAWKNAEKGKSDV